MNFTHKALVLLLLAAFSFRAQPLFGFEGTAYCGDVIAQLVDLFRLGAPQRERQKLFAGDLIGTLGQRVFALNPDQIRAFKVKRGTKGTPESWTWKDDLGFQATAVFSDKTAEELSNELTTLENKDGNYHTRLLVPKDWESLPERTRQGLIRNWLMGHELYPYNSGKDATASAPKAIKERVALGETPIKIRDVQKDAMEVVSGFLKGFYRAKTAKARELYRHLILASATGTGKTEIIKDSLRTALAENKGKNGLYVFVADKVDLVNQLANDILPIQTEGTPFHLVEWSGVTGEIRLLNGKKGQAINNLKDIEELLKTGPVVLVSTIHTLMAEVGLREQGDKINQRKMEVLRKHTRLFGYDEVHHSDSHLREQFVIGLLKDNKTAFGLGVSATPNKDVIAMFGNNAFFAGLIDPKDFLANPENHQVTPAEVVNQLEQAFKDGILTSPEAVVVTPFNAVDPVFVKSSQTQANPIPGEARDYSPMVINPKYYPEILKALEPSLENDQLLIVVNTHQEAVKLNEALQAYLKAHKIKGRTSQVYTGQSISEGKLNPSAIREAFRNGELNILVCVDKLNEGIDLPNATAIADLSYSSTPEEKIQRLGRITRPYAGTGVTYPKTRGLLFSLEKRTASEIQQDIEERRKATGKPKGKGEKGDGGTVHVDIHDFLDRIKEVTDLSEPYDIFEKRKFVLSAAQHQNYKDNVIDELARRFQGSTNAITRVIDGLAGLLPEGERAEFKKRHSHLGKVDVNNSRAEKIGEGVVPATRITEMLLDAARLRGVKNGDKPLTVEDILTGDFNEAIFGKAGLLLTEAQHKAYIINLADFIGERFPGTSKKSLKLVEEVSKLLPDSEQAEFQEQHGNLGNGEALKGSKRPTGAGPSSRITAMALDLARRRGIQNGGKPLSVEDVLSGKYNDAIFGTGSLTLSAAEHDQYKSNAYEFFGDRFRGTIGDATRLVEETAKLLPKEAQAAFKERHAKVKSTDLANSNASVGGGVTPASRIVDMALDAAAILGVKNGNKPLTAKDFVSGKYNEAIFGEGSLKLTPTQHEAYSKKLQVFLTNRFPGGASNRENLVKQLAELLPEKKQEQFREKWGGNNTNDLKASLIQLRPANRIAQMLLDYAELKGVRSSARKPLTVDDLLSGEYDKELFPEKR